MRVWCTSLLAGSQFRVKLVSRPQLPPSTSPVSTRHNCVISSQERKFSIPILWRSAFLHSCIKFAFPRARIPKIPGMRERWNTGARERRNAKPGTCAHLCQIVLLCEFKLYSTVFHVYCHNWIPLSCRWQ